MAGLWEVVAKASNVVQLVGLDAVTMVAIAVSLLRSHRDARTERRRLEESARTLQSLLRTPAGHWIDQQPGTLVAELAANALRDAAGLVESYDGSTMLSQVRRGGSAVVGRCRDLRARIDSYCGAVAEDAPKS